MVLLRRSASVGECPHTVVMPGGHPEPEAMGVASLAEWHGAAGAAVRGMHAGVGWAEKVGHELYDGMVREVVEETGVPREALSEPLCLGFSRRLLNHRPDIIFLIECRIDSTAVARLYATSDGVDRDKSKSLTLLERAELLRRVLDEDDPSLPMPGCHRGGLALYRTYLEHATRGGLRERC